jgi:hypothetical protein
MPFNDYCMVLGIQVHHSISYFHTQNGLEKSPIKRIKLIARPLLMNCSLSTSCWGHVLFHDVELIQLRPTTCHNTFPLQLVRANPPNISHLRKFRCATSWSHHLGGHPWGPHRKHRSYVGYKSSSIIKYSLTGDLFIAYYVYCIFNEEHFPKIGEISSTRMDA